MKHSTPAKIESYRNVSDCTARSAPVSRYLGLGLFPEDEQDVAEFLNREHYQFGIKD